MLYKRSAFSCTRSLLKRHFTWRIKCLVVCISESIGRIFLKLSTPQSSRMTYKHCKVRWAISQMKGTLLGGQNPVDRSQLRALYLKSHVFFGLHLGFHWREFSESLYLALRTHELQILRAGSHWLLIKGILLGKQSTFSAVSRLPLEQFS